MRIINALIIAFSTYSRLPMPQVEWTDDNRKYAMCFFPLIGGVIGLALGLWFVLCEAWGLTPFLRGAVGAIIPLLITGGIHMDGFMDTTDALASWQPREKKLEILKDSRVGAFAVMGCAAYLMLMAAVLSEADAAMGWTVGLSFILSRAMSAWTVTVFPSAHPNGMLDQMTRTAQKRMVTISGIFYVAVCLIAWTLTKGWLVCLCAAAVALHTLYYRRMAMKNFGGVTGDLSGWYSQTMELLLVSVVVLGGKLL